MLKSQFLFHFWHPLQFSYLLNSNFFRTIDDKLRPLPPYIRRKKYDKSNKLRNSSVISGINIT